MPKPLPKELFDLKEEIEQAARHCGLDIFTSCYEVLDYDEINMVAAYGGFPVRYPHWKWGMEYERLKKSHEYGLSKIYEMVINNDPTYAYLMESNSYTDQKIVMCHVTGHNDFFKNNFSFRHTNRKMIDEMANHASRIRRYMDWFGVNEVEQFIDMVLSIENLIDINAPYIVRKHKKKDADIEEPLMREQKVKRIPNEREYMEHYLNPEAYLENQRRKMKEEEEKSANLSLFEPSYDVLGFLLDNAPLKRWQADIIEMVKEEALYFAPQAMTKIMNEGWASYWHTKLMTEVVMQPSELIDFADRNSMVMASSPNNLNPYKLGLMLYRDIEERWNTGRFGSEFNACENMSEKLAWNQNLGLGKEKIFQVRKIYNDLTFVDEFLTDDFCRRHGIFTYEFDKRKQEYVIDSRDFAAIKHKLLQSITNMGQPQIRLVNANYDNRGELLLEHVYHYVELDLAFAKETLKNLALIWRRPVHILSQIDEREILLSHDGENYREELVNRG